MSAPKEFSKLFESKKVYKQQYTSPLSLPFSSQQMVLGYCARTEEDVERFVSMVDGLEAMKIPVILFWHGMKKLPVTNFPEQIRVVSSHDAHYDAMWQACDAVYCFASDDLIKSGASGCVPIAPKSLKGVENYNPITEKGNAFVYETMSPWVMFSAAVRALETYKFPFDWKGIVRNAKR